MDKLTIDSQLERRAQEHEAARRSFPSLVSHYAQWSPVISMVPGTTGLAIVLSVSLGVVCIVQMLMLLSLSIGRQMTVSSVSIYVAESFAILGFAGAFALIPNQSRGRLLLVFSSLRLVGFWIAVVATIVLTSLTSVLGLMIRFEGVARFFSTRQNEPEAWTAYVVTAALLTLVFLTLTFLLQPSLLGSTYALRTGVSATPRVLGAVIITTFGAVAFADMVGIGQPTNLGVTATIGLFIVGSVWRGVAIGWHRRKDRIRELVGQLDALTAAIRAQSESIPEEAAKAQRKLSEHRGLKQTLVVDAVQTPLTYVLGLLAGMDLLSASQDARLKASAMPALTEPQARSLAVDACYLIRRALAEV